MIKILEVALGNFKKTVKENRDKVDKNGIKNEDFNKEMISENGSTIYEEF